MLLQVPSLPGEVWGPAEVGGEDCRIVCAGGEVRQPCHAIPVKSQIMFKVAASSAILAGASPFLASILHSPLPCHCSSARPILLPGVSL